MKNEIDKMLESLSKADINYRDKLIIDMSEKKTYRYSVTEKVEHYKKPRFRFVPVLALSLMIIAGTGFFFKTGSEVAPPLTSTVYETTDAVYSEETAETETYNEAHINYMDFLGIKDPVESMRFSFFGYVNEKRCAYIDNINGSYVILDKNNCFDILQLLTNYHIESNETYGKKSSEKKGDFYPYRWEKDFPNLECVFDDDFAPVNAVEFTVGENIQIRVMLGREKNWFLVKNYNYISYYSLKPEVCEPFMKIISKCISAAVSNSENSDGLETIGISSCEDARFQTYLNTKSKQCSTYEFESNEQCLYILDIIGRYQSSLLKGYEFLWKSDEKHINSHLINYCFPYMYDTGDDYIDGITPNQISICIPSINTEFVLLDYNYNDCLMVINGEQTKYYRIRKCIYFEIYDILSGIEKRKTDLKSKWIERNLSLKTSISDEIELPVVNRLNAYSGRHEFEYSFQVNLKNTHFESMPYGIYKADELNIDAYDKNGKIIPVSDYSAITAQISTEGLLNVNISVQAPPEDDGSLYDFSFCTLKGGFSGIALYDYDTGEIYDSHIYPIKFDFTYYFEAPAD